MSATFDFDRLLGSVLETGDPRAVPETLIENALAEARAVQQRRPRVPALDRRSWPAHRPSLSRRPLAVASPWARVLLLALLATTLVALGVVGSALLREDPVIKSIESRFVRPYEYVVAVDSGMHISGSPRQDLVAWVQGPDVSPYVSGGTSSDGQPSPWQARGLMIGSAEDAWSHSSGGRFMLRPSPAGFLADLRDTSGLRIDAIAETTLDGHPALTAMLPGYGGSDIHTTGRMQGLSGTYLRVTFPARLTVAEIDDTTVFVFTWARNARDLSAWLPVADDFVASIHFLPE